MALFVGPRDLERLFGDGLVTPADCVAAVEASFREMGDGQAGLVPRHILTADGAPPAARSRALKLSASYMRASKFMGASVYTTHFRPGDVDMWITLFSGDTGRMHGVLSGKALSLWKTGATAAVATRHLARPNATRVALLGTGRYAGAQLRCLAAVRGLTHVTCFSRDGANLRGFVSMAQAMLPALTITAAPSARAAVDGADIVTTITTSPTPIVAGAWLTPGVHVNAVGQHAPKARELDTDAIVNGRVFVDARAQALAEKGEIAIPLAAGAITPDHIAGELGDVVAGRNRGRTSAEEITVFCSGGTALEYMGLCAMLVERARASGLGQELND